MTVNRYTKLIKTLKESPTNSMGGVYSLNPQGFDLRKADPPKTFYADIDGNWPSGIPGNDGDKKYVRPAGFWDGGTEWTQLGVSDLTQDFLLDDPTGKSTDGLIAEDGSVKTPLPPNSRHFILGPLVDGYVQNHGSDNYTNIGYLQKDTRQFVLLARIQGQFVADLHQTGARVWDGSSSQLTSYNSNFTLEMAEWFRDQITNNKITNNVPYFYSGGVPQRTLNQLECPNCPSGMFGGVSPGTSGLFGSGTPPTLGTQYTNPPGDSGNQEKAKIFNLTPDQVKTLAMLLALGLSIAAIVAVLFPEPSTTAAGATYLAGKFRFGASLKRALSNAFKRKPKTYKKIEYPKPSADDILLRNVNRATQKPIQPRTNPRTNPKKRFPVGDSYDYVIDFKQKLILERFNRELLNEVAPTGSGPAGGTEVADAYVDQMTQEYDADQLQQAADDANEIGTQGGKGLSDSDLKQIDDKAEQEATNLFNSISNPESMTIDQLSSALFTIYDTNSEWFDETFEKYDSLLPSENDYAELEKEFDEQKAEYFETKEDLEAQIEEIESQYNSGGGSWDQNGIRVYGDSTWGSQFTEQNFESSGQSFSEYQSLLAQIGFFNNESGPDEYGRYIPLSWSDVAYAKENGHKPEQFSGVAAEIVSLSYEMDEIMSDPLYPRLERNIYYSEEDYNKALSLQGEYQKLFKEYVNLWEGPGGFDELRDKAWDYDRRSKDMMQAAAYEVAKEKEELKSELENLGEVPNYDGYEEQKSELLRPFMLAMINDYNKFIEQGDNLEDTLTADAYDNYNWLWDNYGIDAAEWYLKNLDKPMQQNPYIPEGGYVPLDLAQDPFSLEGLTPTSVSNMSDEEKKKLLQQLIAAGLVNSDGTLKAEALSDDITSDMQRELEKIMNDPKNRPVDMPMQRQPYGGNMPTPGADELPDETQTTLAANQGPSTPVKYDSDMKQLVPNQGGGRPGKVRLKPGQLPKAQKNKNKTVVAHYEPPKFLRRRERKDLIENKNSNQKRILREIRQPVEIKKAPSKYKINFSNKNTFSSQTDELVGKANARGQQWKSENKRWSGYETTEKDNIIQDRVGHAKQAFDYMIEHGTQKSEWRTREVQEELNRIAHEKAMLKENPDFKSPFGNVEVSTTEKNIKNFEKVNKIKKVVGDKKVFSNKEIKPEYPKIDKMSAAYGDSRPPELTPDGEMERPSLKMDKNKIEFEHEKLQTGERASAYYKRLDPTTAKSMPDAAYPQIDAFRDQAKKKPK